MIIVVIIVIWSFDFHSLWRLVQVKELSAATGEVNHCLQWGAPLWLLLSIMIMIMMMMVTMNQFWQFHFGGWFEGCHDQEVDGDGYDEVNSTIMTILWITTNHQERIHKVQLLKQLHITNLEWLIRPMKLCIGFLKERRPEFFLGVRLHEHQLAVPEDEDDWRCFCF